MTLESLLGDPRPMLTEIKNTCERWGLDGLACDHVCYRVATRERYDELKTQLTQIAALAAETIVSGRPICIFTLHKPLIFEGEAILCVELPAPKPGSPYPEGWEHAEYVTPRPLAEFCAEHSEVTFDLRAAGKDINPEVAIKIGERYQAKFHTAHILDVIELEKARL